ncbi:MAG: hypothetical protein ACKOQ1_06630 [Actinomycetota bacterium]
MRRLPLASIAVLVVSVSACAPTTIVGPLETTTTTSSTVPATPTGDVKQLLGELADVTDGLGQMIVDGDTSAAKARLAQARAIWEVMEPQIRAAGVDLIEEVQSIIDLIGTAVERKRPADADKAQRFIALVAESAATLLP